MLCKNIAIKYFTSQFMEPRSVPVRVKNTNEPLRVGTYFCTYLTLPKFVIYNDLHFNIIMVAMNADWCVAGYFRYLSIYFM